MLPDRHRRIACIRCTSLDTSDKVNIFVEKIYANPLMPRFLAKAFQRNQSPFTSVAPLEPNQSYPFRLLLVIGYAERLLVVSFFKSFRLARLCTPRHFGHRQWEEASASWRPLSFRKVRSYGRPQTKSLISYFDDASCRFQLPGSIDECPALAGRRSRRA